MNAQEKRGEYMGNVKWLTTGIIVCSLISSVATGVWILSGKLSDIKSDIANVHTEVQSARTEAKEQLTAATTSIHKTIDSNEFNRKAENTAIWTVLNEHGYYRSTTIGMATQRIRIINGKRVIEWVPVK